MSKLNVMILTALKKIKDQEGPSPEFNLFSKSVLKKTNGESIEFVDAIGISDLINIDLQSLINEISITSDEKNVLADILSRLDSASSLAGEEVFF